jgi:hypothetical protein
LRNFLYKKSGNFWREVMRTVVRKQAVRPRTPVAICDICHIRIAPAEERIVSEGVIAHCHCSKNVVVPEGFLPTVYTVHTAVGVVPAACWLDDRERAVIWGKVHEAAAGLMAMFAECKHPNRAEAALVIKALYTSMSAFVRLLPAGDDNDMNAGRMIIINAMHRLYTESMKYLGVRLTLTKPVHDWLESNRLARRARNAEIAAVELGLLILWSRMDQ